MKKSAGIISLIGCCVGIVICCVLVYKAIYLDIKEQEEFIATKEWELRDKENELESKEMELIGVREDRKLIGKQSMEVRKLIKQGYYTHYESETLSERKARLTEEIFRIDRKAFDLQSEISSIKEGQEVHEYAGVEIWGYREDSIKGIQEAIERAQKTINDIMKSIPEVILMGFIGVGILALGVYYVIATRFGSTEPTVLQHLEKENHFIRKQIERRELLVKLENIEKQ